MREAWHTALARSEFDMTEERYLAFRGEVALALANAMSDRRVKLQALATKALGTVAGVEAAIAARIGSDALLALQNDEDEAPDGAGDALLSQLLDIRHQALVEAEAATNHLEEDGAARGRRGRKLTHVEQTLVEALALAWTRHVVPEIRLPRREAKPSSPLLRFVDAMLTHAIGDDRPAPKEILTFLYDHVRPAFRKGGVSDA